MFLVLEEEMISLIPQVIEVSKGIPEEYVFKRRHMHWRLLQLLAHYMDLGASLRSIWGMRDEFHRHNTRFFKKRIMQSLESMTKSADGIGEGLVELMALSNHPCSIRTPYLLGWNLETKSFYFSPPLVAHFYRFAVPVVEHQEAGNRYILRVPLKHLPFEVLFDWRAREEQVAHLKPSPLDPDWRKKYRDFARQNMSWADLEMSDTQSMRMMLDSSGRSLMAIERMGIDLQQYVVCGFPISRLYPTCISAL